MFSLLGRSGSPQPQAQKRRPRFSCGTACSQAVETLNAFLGVRRFARLRGRSTLLASKQCHTSSSRATPPRERARFAPSAVARGRRRAWGWSPGIPGRVCFRGDGRISRSSWGTPIPVCPCSSTPAGRCVPDRGGNLARVGSRSTCRPWRHGNKHSSGSRPRNGNGSSRRSSTSCFRTRSSGDTWLWAPDRRIAA
jgi:hypothetical protein